MNLLQLHEPGETPLPHSDESVAAIGIDLGTTHSVVAFSQGGKAEVLKNIHGHAIIPSVVDYSGEQPVVGHPAREAWAKGNPAAISSIKRHMHQAAEYLSVGGKQRSPVEISADILHEMKHVAERALGRDITQAVVTVPAYFDEAARTATRDAARLAGLTVLRLLNEPTAAALAYGLEKSAEGIYAIYDLGGGTFDISLLKLEQGVFQVLATGGNAQLGGDDFDALIAARLGISEAQARAIKEKLSTEQVESGLTREDFNALIESLVNQTLNACAQALEDAKLAAPEVKGVVLVGGSTRIPLVREKVAGFFGTPPLTDVNPDEVVAIGAAIQAEGLTHGSDTLLLDVIPLSLGLETMGGLTEKLIPRNTPIPVSVAQEFTTYKDNQGGMQIHIVQGEREMALNNRSLARFDLKGIPPLPAGIARIRVSFTVDADGLLTVSAEELHTGTAQRVEIRPSYGLAPEDMERMLRESMERARDDIMERLVVEARVEAERSIEELLSAIKADGDLLTTAEHTQIDRQIGYLREAVAESDRERIDVEMHQLGLAAQKFAERRMDRAIEGALAGKRVNEIKF